MLLKFISVLHGSIGKNTFQRDVFDYIIFLGVSASCVIKNVFNIFIDTVKLFGGQKNADGELAHPYFEAVQQQIFELLNSGAS